MQFIFRQTRTRVHSAAQEQKQRQRGWMMAGRAAAAVQLGAQLILWIFFFGYDRTSQTIWQAVLMLALPLIVLFWVWRGVDFDHPAAKWLMLPLFLCLLLDAAFINAALGGFVSQLTPHYPAWVGILLPPVIGFITALCARPRGVRYGAAMLIAPLVVFFLISTLFLRASSRADRLWPILGDGLLSTARTALTGAGAVWSAALLFLQPRRTASTLKTVIWAALPWLLGVICALWFGFLRPWQPGDQLAVAEKMMGLSRHAHSVLFYEMSGVLWMLLLPLALTACLTTGGEMLRRAFPRLPLWAVLLPAPVLSAAASLLWPQSIFPFLSAALPWRWVISFLCGAGLRILSRRRA